jgi:aerobic carbon-monoxide dehydrogenase small subunit
MKRIALTVNGELVSAEVAPRTHLADFLREDRLLTGTHLGCEHGICGACTLLLNGAPARSCIAFAVACDGGDVRTIEGLEDDPIIVQLRIAFTAEHALQCGYCTPGMLVVARDIVQRLPGADEARVRLELAGNLCRCTGYAGIVRAIQRVLADGASVLPVAVAPLPRLPQVRVPPPDAAAHMPTGTALDQTLRLRLPMEVVWSALRNPVLVAECIPGARVVEVSPNRLRGEVRAALGSIETLFTGEGIIDFDDIHRRIDLAGDGIDSRTGTRLRGRVVVYLSEVDAAIVDVRMAIEYALRGPLAQFARGMIVEEFVAAIAADFAGNLEARLSGSQVPRHRRLSIGLLMSSMIRRRIRAATGRKWLSRLFARRLRPRSGSARD